MCGFALVAIVLDVATSVLHGWLPNIGVGAISIAVTAVVVEELLKRADHTRFAGRVGAAERRLESALLQLVNAAQIDYVQWRRRTGIDVGGDPVEILGRWLEVAEDSARPPRAQGQSTHILDAALYVADAVKRVADAEREHLPPDLVERMDDVEAARINATTIDVGDALVIRGAVDDFRARLILWPARELASAYGEQLRDGWPPLLVMPHGSLMAAEPATPAGA